MGQLIALGFCFLVTAVIVPLFVNLLVDAFPNLAKRLICSAANRLVPYDRDDYRNDWLANLETASETKAGKMYWALQCLKASLVIRPPFLRATWRVRIAWRRLAFVSSAEFLYFSVDRMNVEPGPTLQARLTKVLILTLERRFDSYLDAWCELARIRGYSSNEEVRADAKAAISTFEAKHLALVALFAAARKKAAEGKARAEL